MRSQDAENGILQPIATKRWYDYCYVLGGERRLLRDRNRPVILESNDIDEKAKVPVAATLRSDTTWKRKYRTEQAITPGGGILLTNTRTTKDTGRLEKTWCKLNEGKDKGYQNANTGQSKQDRHEDLKTRKRGKQGG